MEMNAAPFELPTPPPRLPPSQPPTPLPPSLHPSTPSAPPPALPPFPSAPPPPPSCGRVCQALNVRYRSAKPSSWLANAGVLITQFDGPTAWQMCPTSVHACAEWRDRRSATMIYYRAEGNAKFIYTREMGGLVFAPRQIDVLCAYGADGGTRSKTCAGAPRPDRAAACIPGCTMPWCNAPSASSPWCGGAPWQPNDLEKMLRLHRGRHPAAEAHDWEEHLYNEIGACAACIMAHTCWHARPGSSRTVRRRLLLDLAFLRLAGFSGYSARSSAVNVWAQYLIFRLRTCSSALSALALV